MEGEVGERTAGQQLWLLLLDGDERLVRGGGITVQRSDEVSAERSPACARHDLPVDPKGLLALGDGNGSRDALSGGGGTGSVEQGAKEHSGCAD